VYSFLGAAESYVRLSDGFDALSVGDFKAQSRPMHKLTHPQRIGFFFMLEAGQLYLSLNLSPYLCEEETYPALFLRHIVPLMRT
jgi:hypothetical protein